MLQTVEAEIDVSGQIRLLEPLRVSKKSRAIITVLEESNGDTKERGNSKKILEFLCNNRLPDSARPGVKEIGAYFRGEGPVGLKLNLDNSKTLAVIRSA